MGPWSYCARANSGKKPEHFQWGQELAADASVNFYYLTDLHRVVDRFGDRGYRATQLEGGILGGKIYLAAYALGCGATGLTFLDNDVTDFFLARRGRKGSDVPHRCGASRPSDRNVRVTSGQQGPWAFVPCYRLCKLPQ